MKFEFQIDMTRFLATFARNTLAAELEQIANEMSSPNCNSQTMLELTLRMQKVTDEMKAMTLIAVIEDLS